jgi:hypothetical protein
MEHAFPAREITIMGLVAVFVGAVVLAAARWGGLAPVYALFGGEVLALIVVTLTFFPWIDVRKSPAAFCAELRGHAGPASRIAFYDQTKIGAFLYHLPNVRHADVIEPARVYVLGGERIVLDPEARDALPPEARARLESTGEIAPATWRRIREFLAGGPNLMILRESKWRGFPRPLRRELDVVMAERVSRRVYYAVRLEREPGSLRDAQ